MITTLKLDLELTDISEEDRKAFMQFIRENCVNINKDFDKSYCRLYFGAYSDPDVEEFTLQGELDMSQWDIIIRPKERK